MRIDKTVERSMDENTYIVSENGAALVIDPGAEWEKIIKKAEELNVKIHDILLTHGHFDHIRSVAALKEKTGARVWSSAETSRMAGDIRENLSAMFGHPMTLDASDETVEDGKVYDICAISVKAISAPGHTDGCMCYLIGDTLFSGDCLFLRSVGRSDFPTGDGAVLKKSIREKLYTLDDNTVVMPGHGEKTSIGYEKKYNPIVGEEDLW